LPSILQDWREEREQHKQREQNDLHCVFTHNPATMDCHGRIPNDQCGQDLQASFSSCNNDVNCDEAAYNQWQACERR
jgi:hypothetical protein